MFKAEYEINSAYMVCFPKDNHIRFRHDRWINVLKAYVLRVRLDFHCRLIFPCAVRT